MRKELSQEERAARARQIANEVKRLPGLSIWSQALLFATRLHEDQRRKGELPYVSHLFAVASLVFEEGGNEDEVIAALLHDAVEDQGGREVPIQEMFGDAVAEIVDACSDTDAEPKPEWRERKELYLAHLETASPSVLRVSLADKLHNARSILRDLKTHQGQVWERFNAGRDQQLWYYKSLVKVFSRRSPGFMADELRQVVCEIQTESSVHGNTQ